MLTGVRRTKRFTGSSFSRALELMGDAAKLLADLSNRSGLGKVKKLG
jgi:hypothetical protein